MAWPLSYLSSFPLPKQIKSLVSNLSLINICSISVPKEKLRKWLFWNGSFGLLHSQAPPLMIASFINISDLNYDSPFKYASSILSIVVLVLLAVAFAIEINLIRANQGRY